MSAGLETCFALLLFYDLVSAAKSVVLSQLTAVLVSNVSLTGWGMVGQQPRSCLYLTMVAEESRGFSDCFRAV